MRHLFALGFLLLCGASLTALAGTPSFSNLHVIADASGGPGLFARVRYYCGASVWDGVTASVSREANTLTVTIPSSEGYICIGVPPPPEDFDLAIGSLDANRFHPGMGTVFLRLIAEAMSAAVGRYSTGD